MKNQFYGIDEATPANRWPSLLILVLLILEVALLPAFSADPQIDSWFTSESGKYARVYRTTADQRAGRASDTWSSSGGNGQSLPVYNGVQEVDSSADWVYVRSSGLGIHVMGPWYLDPQKTQLFPNAPVNTKTLYRLPRHPTQPAQKTLTGLGPIGIFVDGVAMYDSRDAFAWNGTTETGGPNAGYWNRDAYVNEWPSFDPSNAHQDQSGTYHYHANPPGLRNLLGDNVLQDPVTKLYRENTANPHPKHSPILGWVSDGFPIYGPYGYSDPKDTKSEVRRMVSGYVLRDGKNGADNLAATGRATLPAWAVRLYKVSANQAGPPVSQRYPLGRYMEDHAYLGDLERKQGADFDLDECNGRFCVTPEFPKGTYAYFVSIDARGTPVFPYNIGRAFHGDPTGGSGTGLPEKVVTNFIGGPDAPAISTPVAKVTNNSVTLVWSSVEGGSYQVESSADAANWTDTAKVESQGLATKTTLPATSDRESYRVVRTALAQYDPVTTAGVGRGGRRGGPGGPGGQPGGQRGPRRGGGAPNGVMVEGITSVNPSFGSPGQNVTVTIKLNQNAEPPLPPGDVPVAGVMVGGIKAVNLRRSGDQVQATVAIPANATAGVQAVTLAFPPPPFDPNASLSYTLTNAFTIR